MDKDYSRVIMDSTNPDDVSQKVTDEKIRS